MSSINYKIVLTYTTGRKINYNVNYFQIYSDLMTHIYHNLLFIQYCNKDTYFISITNIHSFVPIMDEILIKNKKGETNSYTYIML